MVNSYLRYIAVCTIALSVASSVTLGIERGVTTTSAPAESEPRDTVLYLREDGKSIGGWVAIRGDDAVERHYVPKEGLKYSIGADGIELRYVNVITDARKTLWRGEKSIDDVRTVGKSTVMDLTEIAGRMVTIKAVAEDGTPLANTRLEVSELWDGREVSVAGGNPDDAGTVRLYLADDNVYRARVRWKHSVVASESKRFMPKVLEDSEFTFTPLTPEKACFAIKLVIAENDRERPATNVRMIEMLSDKQSVLAAVFDGRVLIRLDGNEDFNVKPGDKIRLRYGSDKYEIREPVVTVDKAGTSVEVALIPIKTSLLLWSLTTEGSTDGEPEEAAIYIRPADGDHWTRTDSSGRWKCVQGKYEIAAFAYGYRLYRSRINATKSQQTVPIKLVGADKCRVIVTLDNAGPRDVNARVVYPRQIIGPLTTRLRLKDGKSDVYYDSEQQAGLLVYARGYGPKLVSLDGKTSVLRVSLKAARPIRIVVDKNDVVKGINASLLDDVKIVSTKPWRHVIAGMVDHSVWLGVGTYVPIIDLAVKGAPPSLMGKVVECEPLTIGDDTDRITLVPRRIVAFDDVLKTGDDEK